MVLALDPGDAGRDDVDRVTFEQGPQVAARNFARLARAVLRGVPLPLASIDNRRSLLGVDNLVDALVTLLASCFLPIRPFDEGKWRAQVERRGVAIVACRGRATVAGVIGRRRDSE